jgi:hypothetical protein
MFPDDPSDRVNDIGFTTAIRPDDPCDPLVEVDRGFIGKTFKPLDFQTF